mgnify:CR=1 FL=1
MAAKSNHLSLTHRGPTGKLSPLSASFPSWNRKRWTIVSLDEVTFVATTKSAARHRLGKPSDNARTLIFQFTIVNLTFSISSTNFTRPVAELVKSFVPTDAPTKVSTTSATDSPLISRRFDRRYGDLAEDLFDDFFRRHFA